MGQRWEDALDAQVDIWSFTRSPLGKIYGENYKGTFVNGDLNYQVTFDPVGSADIVREAEISLWNADPIYVDNEMFDLVNAASETFQPEVLKPTDLLIPAGFVLFPRPFEMLDARGKLIRHRAMSWFTHTFTYREPGKKPKSGVSLIFYHNKNDRDDYYNPDYVDIEPMWVPADSASWIFHEDLPTESEIHDYLKRVEAPYELKNAVGASLIGVAKFVLPFWRLMQQTITMKEKLRTSSPFRKRAERAKFPEKNVTVITLRRPHRDNDHDPVDVEWSHRWLVGGHWRNQWFPSLGIHRQIWISPYIKGPEDKPLEIRKARAFEFVR